MQLNVVNGWELVIATLDFTVMTQLVRCVPYSVLLCMLSCLLVSRAKKVALLSANDFFIRISVNLKLM